jgi:hypothetical protein
MNVKDALQAWLNQLSDNLVSIMRETSPELWQWQPMLYRHTIPQTGWHVLRDLDVLTTQILQEKSPNDEIWCQQSPSYNPHGKGYKGLGTMIGYGATEVAEMPAFTQPQLDSYHQAIQSELNQWLNQSSIADLHKNVSFLGSHPYPAHIWIYNKLRHAEGHLAEIAGIQALWQLQNSNPAKI